MSAIGDRKVVILLAVSAVVLMAATAMVAVYLTRNDDRGQATSATPTRTPLPWETTPSSTPEAPPTYAIGETLSAVQVEVTITKVEAVDLGKQGDPGFRETVEAFTKVCTPTTAPVPWEVSGTDFVAVTNEGLVIPVNTTLSGVREPTLPYGPVPQGRCVQGWVQIGMDTGQARTVTAVEFQPNAGETTAAWGVDRALRLGRGDQDEAGEAPDADGPEGGA